MSVSFAAGGAQPPLLSIENLTLTYRTDSSLVTAAWRVSFQVAHGDRLILLGQSGCGKSSLLKAIGGYLPAAEGKILLDGRVIDAPGPDRMFVFQEFDQLLPWRSVLDNIAFPLEVAKGLSRSQARDIAAHFMGRVGLAKFAHAFPHALSGGMKQRVAIARAFAMEPKVLLMDEPFASLDAMTRRQMQTELLDLWKEAGITLIFVTHSVEEALLLGDRLLLLSPHPGTVRAEVHADHTDFSTLSPAAFQALHRDVERILFESETRGITA